MVTRDYRILFVVLQSHLRELKRNCHDVCLCNVLMCVKPTKKHNLFDVHSYLHYDITVINAFYVLFHLINVTV